MQVVSPRLANHLLSIVVGIVIVGLVAALTHLTSVLIIPDVATKDAFTLLEPHGTINRMVLLAPSRPGDSLIPFRDPQTMQGICYFDLGASPVRIKAKVEEGHLLMLSFRTPEGKIFYSMTDQAALRGAIDIRLVTEDQLNVVEDADPEDAGLPSELRLKAPTKKGLIVATALVARPSEGKEAEAVIQGVTCAPEALPQPEG